MASDSEEELDNFFRHRGPIRKPSPSVPPRSKRRKSSQDDTSSGASADEEGDDASEASSDLEIVGGSTSKQKGKGKAKTKSKEKATTTGRRGRTSLAAPRPLETSSKRAKLVSVDSSSPESSPGHGVRSSTQLLEGGDALEAMARQLGGWKGEGRPPRVGKEAPAAAATSESPETTGKSKRQTSASTAATSSSATKTKSKSAAPRTTKKAPTSTRKKRAPARDDSSPPIELEPAFVEQPPPPDSFWGVKEALPGVSAKKKPVAGEASKRLQEMSKLPPLRARKDDDDEIMGSSQGTSDEQDATGGKYETVTAKAARLRKEALAEQKARREAKQAAAASPKPAPKPKPAAQPSILLSLQKKHCPVCNSAVAPADIEHHTQQCIAAMMEAQTQEQAEIQPPPPPKPKPNPQPPPPPPPPAKITPRQPPPPPKRPVVNRASSHDGYIDSSQLEVIDQEQNLAEELFPPSPSPKRHTAAAKGKGRAVVQEEEDEVEDDYGAYGDENEPYGAEEEDDYGEFEYDDEGEGALWEDPADFAKLHGTTREVIEIGSDDDESVQVATKARMGGGGAVNTGRAKGPPKDGSPPPTGSIYVSTLPHAMRVGYAQMYREKSPKKGESRSSDPLAPQKMTAAAAKPAFRGKGRRGGWGRGRARGGGAKRGARGRK